MVPDQPDAHGERPKTITYRLLLPALTLFTVEVREATPRKVLTGLLSFHIC
jgi:hypothetical protein